LKNQLHALETPKLIVDLSGVPHVDSIGIGIPVNALMSRKKHGGSLVLSGVNDRAMAVLKGTQVDQLFRFTASAD